MQQRIYNIPKNYLGGKKYLNGLFPLRNVIEAGVLGLLGVLFCGLFPVKPDGRIPFYILVCGPLVLLGLSGIEGDPVSVYLLGMIRWRRHKQPYFYNAGGSAYAVTAADIMLKTPTMRDYINSAYHSIRKTFEKPKPEYIEGENFQFAQDPEWNILEEADKQVRAESEESDPNQKQAPAPEEKAPGNLDLSSLVDGDIPLEELNVVIEEGDPNV